MNRLEKHFDQARAEGRKSLVMFLSAGFPTLETTERLVPAIAEGGCDVLELGVPFSDPVADGPTIQAASQEALRAGVTLEKILDMVGRLRKRVDLPIVLFGAFNPFLHYGLDGLARRAREVGADAVLAPDIPIEESAEIEEPLQREGLSFVQLVAPSTPPDRMRQIAERGSGFLYYISLKGVTGTEIRIGEDLREHVETLKAATELPVAVGFGVRTPEHARSVAEIADAVVVGSALIRLIDEHRDADDLEDRVRDFVRSLKDAIG